MPVISATGGFDAQLTPDPLRSKHRLPIALPTFSEDHFIGKCLKKSIGTGPERGDFEGVRIHPTGFVHPSGEMQDEVAPRACRTASDQWRSLHMQVLEEVQVHRTCAW